MTIPINNVFKCKQRFHNIESFYNFLKLSICKTRYSYFRNTAHGNWIQIGSWNNYSLSKVDKIKKKNVNFLEYRKDRKSINVVLYTRIMHRAYCYTIRKRRFGEKPQDLLSLQESSIITVAIATTHSKREPFGEKIKQSNHVRH